MCDHSMACVRMLVVLCIPFSPALAESVYRCPQPDGGIQFQQFACEQGVQLELSPVISGWRGLRQAEREALRAKPGVSASRGDLLTVGSQTDWQSKGDNKACLKRRDRLKHIQYQLRAGYRPAEGERLRRQRDEIRDWLRHHC